MTDPTPTTAARLSIAEALWKVHEGYTVEDMPEPVPWSPLNAEDVAEKAMLLGHAAAVLEHLIAAGWRPPGDSAATDEDEDRAPRYSRADVRMVLDELEQYAMGAGRVIRGGMRLCRDPRHDDRWCGTCSDMEDGVDFALRWIRESMPGV